MNKKENKKEPHVISVGPILIKCLNKQKENIKKESYMTIDSSFYDAGEILGKKILDHDLV